MKHFFTSESVTEGHPDKLCDLISDSVLDAILELDPTARVACECAATTGVVFVMGEITTNCYVDIQAITRAAIKSVGYDKESGFDPDTLGVITSINEQSPDIAMGVNLAYEAKTNSQTVDKYAQTGAGDQGMMFGYACDETQEFMPLALSLSHKLAQELTRLRKDKVITYLRPDGKTQVTVEYNGKEIKRIDAIVISAQHDEKVDNATLQKDIKEQLIDKTVPSNLIDQNTKIFINPTGRFEIGGPRGDSGLTGRKIIVDTYGGKCPHGGGAFSGKDPTKVDRSAAYMARYICKNIVAAGLAKECTIEIAYAIGVAKPVSIAVDTHATGILADDKLCQIIEKEFDLRPLAIIEKLNLRSPIYKKTSSYGHFGRDIFPWEKLDAVEVLKKYI